MTFYNDNDPNCCAWIRELIADKLISPGVIDGRSICDIKGADLAGYNRCHFFGGIAGWDYALHLAGFPENREVWTGSCPCPPFSVAGRQKACPQCATTNLVCCPRQTGFFICCECGHEWLADARHLWPELWRLIAECRPDTIFGEQVSGEDGRIWLAGVRASLETLGYSVGAADICSPGVGAPHIRQRLYWVAVAQHAKRRAEQQINADTSGRNGFRGSSDAYRLAESAGARQFPGAQRRVRSGEESARARHGEPERRGGVGISIKPGLEGHAGDEHDGHEPGRERTNAPRSVAETSTSGGLAQSAKRGRRTGPEQSDRTSGNAGEESRLADAERDGRRADESGRRAQGREAYGWFGFWSDAIWHPCGDGKIRRISPEPALFPLANGLPGRVAFLRGAGNSICPEVAAEFVKAFLETEQ